MQSAQLDDGHQCRGCWTLQEGTFADGSEEIVAHEDSAGQYITITDAECAVERYPMESDMTKAYLRARGLDCR